MEKETRREPRNGKVGLVKSLPNVNAKNNVLRSTDFARKGAVALAA